MPRPSRPRPPSDPAPLAADAPRQSRSAPPLRYAPAILILLVSTALGVALVITGSPPAPESEVVDRPVQMTGDGYVSSDTCRACHPAEYESWHGSYHRTMTQVATPDTVRADFDGVQVDAVHGDPMHQGRIQQSLSLLRLRRPPKKSTTSGTGKGWKRPIWAISSLST